MKRIAKARYTEEFKVAAVQLIDAGRRPAEVAREIGVVEETLHDWLKAHHEGRLGHGQAVKVTPEQMKEPGCGPRSVGSRWRPRS